MSPTRPPVTRVDPSVEAHFAPFVRITLCMLGLVVSAMFAVATTRTAAAFADPRSYLGRFVNREYYADYSPARNLPSQMIALSPDPSSGSGGTRIVEAGAFAELRTEILDAAQADAAVERSLPARGSGAAGDQRLDPSLPRGSFAQNTPPDSLRSARASRTPPDGDTDATAATELYGPDSERGATIGRDRNAIHPAPINDASDPGTGESGGVAPQDNGQRPRPTAGPADRPAPSPTLRPEGGWGQQEPPPASPTPDRRDDAGVEPSPTPSPSRPPSSEPTPVPDGEPVSPTLTPADGGQGGNAPTATLAPLDGSLLDRAVPTVTPLPVAVATSIPVVPTLAPTSSTSKGPGDVIAPTPTPAPTQKPSGGSSGGGSTGSGSLLNRVATAVPTVSPVPTVPSLLNRI